MRDVSQLEPESPRQRAEELLIGHFIRRYNDLPQRLIYRFATAELLEPAATNDLLNGRCQPFVPILRYGTPPSFRTVVNDGNVLR